MGKLFVGGLAWATKDEGLRAHFEQCGDVTDAKVIMERDTGRSRGFGFVTFENEDVVDRVCEIHFHTIKNKKVSEFESTPPKPILP